MELTGERLIAADRPTTWAALNDPEVLQACIAGCESLERTGDDAFAALVAVRVGPVSAKFKGRLQMQDVIAPEGCTILFEGQGGAAGFGKGSAQVSLAEQGADTLLRYTAKAQVGGKMAQVGARLVDAAAAKLAADFFAAFEARLAALRPPEAAPSATIAAPVAAAAPSGRGRQTLLIGLVIAVAIVALGLYEALK